MKLPQNTRIPHEKLLKYLLVFKDEDDKSKFLSIAGYGLSNWELLEKDIRVAYKILCLEMTFHLLKPRHSAPSMKLEEI